MGRAIVQIQCNDDGQDYGQSLVNDYNPIPSKIMINDAGNYNNLTLENPMPVKNYAKTIEDAWHYAAQSGGITTTDVVTLKASVTGKRNYITSLQLMNSGANPTDVVVFSGLTPLWRYHLVSEQGQVHVEAQTIFGNAIPSAIGEALTFQCLTAGAKVYCNAQGFTSD